MFGWLTGPSESIFLPDVSKLTANFIRWESRGGCELRICAVVSLFIAHTPDSPKGFVNSPTSGKKWLPAETYDEYEVSSGEGDGDGNG